MAYVSIQAVQKYFGQTHIIKGVSFDIADGEFCVLVGPSGCGKSTLLRMIAGLEEISDGTISIGNKVVNDMQPKERDIAMVFQNYALYPHMTVRDNMSFSLMLAKLPKDAIETQVHKAADILGLKDLLDRFLANFQAVNANAWPWAAPSYATRRCFYLTNRSLIWTRNSAWLCAPKSKNCINALKPHPSTSPMTKSKP